MLRAALSFAFALLLTSCAHERSSDADHQAAVATARFVVQSIAPAGSEDYHWDAVMARVSDTEWDPPSPARSDNGDSIREGRLRTAESERTIVARGNNDNMGGYSIATDEVNGLAVLEALRQAGADVSFQGDYESYSEYIVTPAGGDVALLTTNSTCIPFDPQPGEVCRNYVTLTFNPY